MSEEEAIVESLKGSVIAGCSLTEEGAHFVLEDGRVVVFAGNFILGVTRPDKQTLN